LIEIQKSRQLVLYSISAKKTSNW